ncbi:metallophosphoesterase [Neobacillus sp. NPDC093127]|uniref:metallophosphoesterase n=1 Tax=Neobacillus sp. NPDC093127 TaxID=3364296 RepID=UPI00381275A4
MKYRLVALMSLMMIIGWMKPLHIAEAAGSSEQLDNPLLQFPVMSDIHIGEEIQKARFTNALNDYRMVAPKYQAIAMVGDITDNGTEQDYDNFNLILNTNINKDAEKVITIGNHEYFEGVFAGAEWDLYFFMKRFVEKTGMPGDGSQVYYDKWIEGYHFITLGGEGFPSQTDHDHANITDKQYSWLEETLADQAEETKPIFVFLHQAIDGTVYGSDDWGAGFQDSRLSDLLKQYPQVILFSGHSHYLLNHPRTIYQDGFTMVNAGSVAYTFSDAGYNKLSQGLLVNVYSDRVEIKARDLTNHQWIQTFTVPTPFEKTYGDEQNPYFGPGSTATIDKNINGDKVTISWDAAIDDTVIEKYVIKNNGSVIYTLNMPFWESGPPKKRISAELANLTPETAYNLEIIAVDGWKKVSETSLNASFKTPKLYGWKWEEGKWRFFSDGVRVTGWQKIDDKWYLFLKDGFMHTGWYESGSKKYYLNDNGAMQIGWKEIDGVLYYFSSDGSVQSGWVLDRGSWYYLKSDGKAIGWQRLDTNIWYFFDSSGVMKTGWIQSNGKWYYLDNSGSMKVGWIMTSGKWYFLDGSGAMKTGWLKSGSVWYYLDGSGAMKTGWWKSGSAWYYLDQKGAMKTGWLLLGNKWYYLQKSGEMKTGWLNENGKWYFLLGDGSMAKNTTIQGYLIGNDGVWKK